jgi:hypothetical protein
MTITPPPQAQQRALAAQRAALAARLEEIEVALAALGAERAASAARLQEVDDSALGVSASLEHVRQRYVGALLDTMPCKLRAHIFEFCETRDLVRWYVGSRAT